MSLPDRGTTRVQGVCQVSDGSHVNRSSLLAADILPLNDTLDVGIPMADTFDHHPWTVQGLVTDIDNGRVRLPDIQRPFVWSNTKVRDLVDSMYRGYPVGELMFWANQSPDHTRSIGHGTQQVSLQVVDGQQRLTSLFAVVKGQEVWREDYSRGIIRIAFSPIHERFEVPTPAILGRPEWIDDITTVFDDPIEARHSFLERYLKSLEGSDVTVDERHIEKIINRVANIKNFPFQVVQLKEDVARETVADIFVRINSEGVSLSQSDFILTWMSVFWEEGRQQLENFARDSRFTPEGISQRINEKITWTPHNPYLVVDPSNMVRVAVAVGLRRGRLSQAYNRLRGRDPRTREINKEQRETELARLKVGQERALNPLHWDAFLKVVERSGLRAKELISSRNSLLYAYAIWLIGREDFDVPVDKLREVVARWLFLSQLTGRYSGSFESRIEEDIARIDANELRTPEVFISTLDSLMSAAAPPDFWTITLPERLITSSVKAPVYLAYVAALNILDADVLLSTMSVRDWLNPNRSTVKGVEKHHLFPKDHLVSKLGIRSTKRTNQVANFALVEWSTNIDISNDAPAEYWPQQLTDKHFEGERLSRQMGWHALPLGWTEMDYDEFLARRRELMAHITHEGFKRLSDPSYVPSLSTAQQDYSGDIPTTLLTLSELVMGGYLPAGTLLSGPDGEMETLGEITDEGTLRVGTHDYESLTQAARHFDEEVEDGWDYWVAHLAEGAAEPTPVRSIRESASSSAQQ